MDIGALLRGIAVGFSIAAPVGPIGLLCIRRTLARGRIAGFVSGLGAATADALYGAVAAFGLTLVSDALVSQQRPLRLAGGVFLCYLGTRIFLARPGERAASPGRGGLLGAYASTLVLTLTNPTTILSFAAIFAGLGMAGSAGYKVAAAFVLGVFLGSAAWWLVLSGGVGLFSGRLGGDGLRWVNRISGAIIAGFGAVVLLTLWR